MNTLGVNYDIISHTLECLTAIREIFKTLFKASTLFLWYCTVMEYHEIFFHAKR